MAQTTCLSVVLPPEPASFFWWTVLTIRRSHQRVLIFVNCKHSDCKISGLCPARPTVWWADFLFQEFCEESFNFLSLWQQKCKIQHRECCRPPFRSTLPSITVFRISTIVLSSHFCLSLRIFTLGQGFHVRSRGAFCAYQIFYLSWETSVSLKQLYYVAYIRY